MIYVHYLVPYLKLPYHLTLDNNNAILLCPSQTTSLNEINQMKDGYGQYIYTGNVSYGVPYGAFYHSYCMNYYLTEAKRFPYRSIVNPAETLLVADGYNNFHLGYIAPPGGSLNYDFRHMNSFNINYFDGHVQSTGLEITPTTNNDLPWDYDLDGE